MKLAELPRTRDCQSLSAIAKHHFKRIERWPLFFSDWDRALFIHFEVDPDVLQPQIPFELDLQKGKAIVSLVAFTMRDLRLSLGGRFSAFLTAPVATHPLLNVRTYIRHHGEAGIYFMTEWIPNRLSILVGPRTYGLPYRYGKLNYQHNHENGSLRGVVTPGNNTGRFAYEADIEKNTTFKPCDNGTLSHFLLERYTAFTKWRKQARLFRIWHKPWLQTDLDVTITDDSALRASGTWYQASRLVGANYSPGTKKIWMGMPRRVHLRVLLDPQESYL